MRRKRHPRALAIWKEYAPVRMNTFPTLTDEQIEAILAYTNYEYVY